VGSKQIHKRVLSRFTGRFADGFTVIMAVCYGSPRPDYSIDRVFACFGQTVRSPISDPRDQIGVTVAWYYHVIVSIGVATPWYYHVLVSIGVAVAWYHWVMVMLGDVKTMRSLGDTTVR
jgi:hypothetical protein